MVAGFATPAALAVAALVVADGKETSPRSGPGEVGENRHAESPFRRGRRMSPPPTRMTAGTRPRCVLRAESIVAPRLKPGRE